VPFCDLRVRLLEVSVKLQAQSYAGVFEAHEIERSVNYARAIAVWCGPCRVELKELEKFQQDHPELVVLTAVDTTADSKDLRDLIREEALESLRIAPTPPGVMEKFGAYGYPNTLVIDEKGFVRIEQLGGGASISRYLMAGLDAIHQAELPGSGEGGKAIARFVPFFRPPSDSTMSSA
jgi:thiol-disulfide isomerase/thioredoxin